MSVRRHLALTLLTLGLLVAAGCGGPTREDPIHARNDAEFETWVGDHTTVFTNDEIKELNDARQQIKFLAMTDHPNTDPETFASAVYAKIDGHTVRDVLVTGYLLLIDREKVTLANYEPELAKLRRYVDNQRLEEEQRRFFSENMLRIKQQIQEHRDKLAQLQKRLDELKQQPAAAKP